MNLVAQISNLPYRRFPNRQPCEFSSALNDSKVSQAGSPAIQQIGNLRYSGEAVQGKSRCFQLAQRELGLTEPIRVERQMFLDPFWG